MSVGLHETDEFSLQLEEAVHQIFTLQDFVIVPEPDGFYFGWAYRPSLDKRKETETPRFLTPGQAMVHAIFSQYSQFILKDNNITFKEWAEASYLERLEYLTESLVVSSKHAVC